MSSFSLALICGLALVSLASAATIQSCEDAGGSQAVTIPGCSGSTCIFKKGSTASFMITFKATSAVSSLTNKISAKVFGISLPFPGQDGTKANSQVYNQDGSPAAFPLSAGQTYVYKNEFAILTAYPSISTTVNYYLKGDDGSIPVCFKVKAKIQN